MEVGIHANACDNKTAKIAEILRGAFEVLEEKLQSDYGGIIEHLWIDFELIQSEAKANGLPSFPFRFQKRVSGRSPFGLPALPDYLNVGHLSVNPNFSELLSLPKHQLISYCLNLIYKELGSLKAKEKKLGGFNSQLFKDKFSEECEVLGYTIKTS